jgi:hypothetical protein
MAATLGRTEEPVEGVCAGSFAVTKNAAAWEQKSLRVVNITATLGRKGITQSADERESEAVSKIEEA